MTAGKQDIIAQLRKDILLLEGFKPSSAGVIDLGLGPVTSAFPNRAFPTGAIHEFISLTAENTAATVGFVSGLSGPLMGSGGACIWIACTRKIFPAGLKTYGIEPDRVIFVDVKKERDILWVMEEALKCEGLAVVAAEIPEISFTASRRLQLAVEHSKVTGFLLRQNPRNVNANACVARWKISTLASRSLPGMPGIGFSRWTVELAKIRNGKPGIWEMEWLAGRFRILTPEAAAVTPEEQALLRQERRKTG
jgi:protein ImuA